MIMYNETHLLIDVTRLGTLAVTTIVSYRDIASKDDSEPTAINQSDKADETKNVTIRIALKRLA